MLEITKVQNPRTGTVHLVKDGYIDLCGHGVFDAVDVPPEGPKCHCKDCLEALEQLMRQERHRPDYCPRFESFNEQRHSM